MDTSTRGRRHLGHEKRSLHTTANLGIHVTFPVMVATGQEMVREKILQGQGNVREFYSGSGKIGILKKSQGKLKL